MPSCVVLMPRASRFSVVMVVTGDGVTTFWKMVPVTTITSSAFSTSSAETVVTGEASWANAGALTSAMVSASGAAPARRAVRVDFCIAVPFSQWGAAKRHIHP